MNTSVSGDAVCPPSLRSMFNPSVQSAHWDWLGAIWSASDIPLAVRRENDTEEAIRGEVEPRRMSG